MLTSCSWYRGFINGVYIYIYIDSSYFIAQRCIYIYIYIYIYKIILLHYPATGADQVAYDMGMQPGVKVWIFNAKNPTE